MTTILFVDVETGGLDPTTDALLEVGLVLWRDGLVVDTAEIAVNPEGLCCDPEALKVNGIDLATWRGINRQAARYSLHYWLVDRFPNWREQKIQIGGHNPAFDVGFLRQLLRGSFDDLFSHRLRDTCSTLRFLADAGLVPEGITSLDKACAHFGIERAQAHRALPDALATAELYTRLLALVAPSGARGEE